MPSPSSRKLSQPEQISALEENKKAVEEAVERAEAKVPALKQSNPLQLDNWTLTRSLVQA